MTIRTFFRSDLARVLAIEEAVSVVPWNEETFKICFREGYHGWVLEQNKQIAGFVIVSLRVGECHIMNICVDRPFQHQGLGQQLLTHALEEAKQIGAGIAYLEVRRSNTRAIALYRKMKFHLVGERKGYYPTISGREDALIFAKSLHQPE